jgi:Tol biopolymer transport system component
MSGLTEPLREALRRVAEQADPPTALPPVVQRRVRRRQAVIGALVLGSVTLIGIGAVRAVLPGSPIPTSVPPVVTSSPSPSALEPPADAVVFAQADSDSTDAQIEIAYVPASGGEVQALTRAWGEGAVAAQPRWSPDGSRIAFVMTTRRLLTRSDWDGNIYMMNADGSDVRRLTEGLNSASPAWSPDGSQIVFVSNHGQQLVVMNADGSGPHVIASEREFYAWPSWSPRGDRIAFQSGDFEYLAIFTIASDGSSEVRLTDGLRLEAYPAWAPDGSQIAYSAGVQLWIMAGDGGDQHPVTTCDIPCMADIAPSWAPDGSRLVFARWEQGGAARRLYILDLGTGEVLPLTPNLRWASWPGWRPAGHLSPTLFGSGSVEISSAIAYGENGSGQSMVNRPIPLSACRSTVLGRTLR